MSHETLSAFASEAEVMELLFNAIMETGYGNEYIYDDTNDRCISVDDVRSIIEQMKAAEELL